ncbi:MAG: type II secretion system F family protein [Candidatus Goldbacteria bacterium]|nr:type II secretion system F family protein [Candidatus Goldiibacteriota bacterium]
MKIIASIFLFAAAALAVYQKDKIASVMSGFVKNYRSGVDVLVKKSVAEIKGNEIRKLQIVLFILFAASAVIMQSVFIPVLFVPAVYFLPKYYLSYKHKKYCLEYRKNLPAFLESMISGMKSGLSLPSAMSAFAARDKSPVGREVKAVLSGTQLGISMAESLSALALKIPVRENVIMLTALETALETGGNVSEILGGILETIRKRDEADREIKALTSQGVMSGITVGLLPVLLIGAITFIDPSFTEPLFNTKAGMFILCTAVVMEAAGAFFISRIVRIE